MTGVTPLLAAEGIDFAYGHGRPVLRDVSLSLAPGESLGLVGESGAGKTSLLRLLLGLQSPTGGRVLFDGTPLDRRSGAEMRRFRRAVQPVYQDPFSSLDPRMTVGESIAEPLRSLRVTTDRAGRAARVAELLAAVDLPADAATRYPDAFSGGQRQRIAIARALAPRPRLILADEPVSALDTSVRMHVIELFQRLSREQGIGMLLVSHDLTIVSALCARMAVLESGRIVEEGPTARLLSEPEHPYTRRLLASVPRLPRPAGR
ncbi:ATP-binding cassette domain-containing protein [Microbacterium sp. zg.Y1090]|uniref:ABC transporter ATP-binding protein n=1 Tax=Microbacterium wangruii TaxID=3049073 RepID=UPI00214D5037|nr:MULTISPECIES: ATP-binding cassette domain-containing protein [unclassified Microbacterium]MCR2819949.1 ATP-binding cassette domain-containing protein [Microbacterium sp. zg.Y1090]MDL5488181.1 ATP-binding cassette domain-containing protein [Microbacterium sp. zg-Y1211]WIM29319.1 ATP-binding cassette domain-containing protein [Microbacterium sp. zg-Y1090]